MERNDLRKRRHRRIRKRIYGSNEKPRMSIFRSLKNIYVQIIDDSVGKTLVSVSTLSEGFKEKKIKSNNIEAAKVLGKLVAEKAVDAGIKKVVFDRGGYLYHGRIRALAETARENGLEF